MTRTSDKTLAEQYRCMLLLIEKHRDVIDDAGQYQAFADDGLSPNSSGLKVTGRNLRWLFSRCYSRTRY